MYLISAAGKGTEPAQFTRVKKLTASKKKERKSDAKCDPDFYWVPCMLVWVTAAVVVFPSVFLGFWDVFLVWVFATGGCAL